MRKMRPLHERFMSNVLPEPNSGCWLWAGFCNPGGYGKFTAGPKNEYAHRLSYRLFVGEIPQGLELDHLCRVRCCVNPSHLEPVTKSVNAIRGIGTLHLLTEAARQRSSNRMKLWWASKSYEERAEIQKARYAKRTRSRSRRILA